MRLLLQFPEGLKRKALEYADAYRREGHQVYFSASPCFGACDLPLEEARLLNADKIIHFGHSKFIKNDLDIPVEYVEVHYGVDISSLNLVLPELSQYNIIALATTVQHIHQLQEIKKFFSEKGKKFLTGKGTFASYEGQVLGCDPGAVLSVSKDADAILFIGDGLFHPLAINSEKPVFVFNPYSKQLTQINDKIERLRKKRKGTLNAALSSDSFGILVSTKPGQFNLKTAEKIKKDLDGKGKKAEILIANTFDPLSIQNFYNSFDCFISTACPRISDDGGQFGKPVMDLALYSEFIKLI
ncbi:diphthamide biosynthesis enzyme Dph2 [Candidatus Micrarchaeota archaeon]|nr:diphthamide biosynthesis enzyme Dph2 [Candidatus Micrarchaeota archaeon]